MSTAQDDAAAICELAYSEGIRAVSDQSRTLDQVRVRVAGVLATATTAGAFLVGIVAKANGDDQDLLYWLGVVAGAALYGWLVWLTVKVLQPKYEWRFTLSAEVIISGWVDHESPATLGETYRDLACRLDDNARYNQVNLDLMQIRLGRALVALLALVACWACLVAKVA